MNTLREINLEMDGMTKSVEQIEFKCSMTKGAKKSAFDAEEQKKLMKDIDESLGHSRKSPSPKRETDREPRNYHPPESPVRRVYENGYELDQRTALENYPTYINPQRPHSTFDNGRAATNIGTPGYQQTLYNAAQR